jgi:hypothetical protein
MAGFIYQNSFEHEMYLEADIGSPKYIITEESVEDKDGNPVYLKRKMDKTYNIHVVLRQYQIDALMFCLIHKNKTVYLSNGQAFAVRTMSLSEPLWDTCGAFAEVDIDFTLDPVVSTACCVNETLFPEDSDLGDYIGLRYAVTISTGDLHEAVIPINCKSGTQLYIDWGDGAKITYVAQPGLNLLSKTYATAGAPSIFNIKIYGDISDIYALMTNDISLGTLYETNENVTDIVIPAGCARLTRFLLNKEDVINSSNGSLAINAGNTGLQRIEFAGNDFTSFFTINAFVYLNYLNGYDNKLSTTEINKILCSIDVNNISTETTRVIILNGGTNQAPDTTSGGENGVAAKASLISKGWSVTTN